MPHHAHGSGHSHGDHHGRAIVLVEDVYEDLELHYPRLRLMEAGFDVQVVGPKAGEMYTSKHGYPVKADAAFTDITANAVEILVIPGGYAPDRLRRHDSCLELVRKCWESGAIVAVICHGAWVPISAGILHGRRLTSFRSIRDDVRNAGADWVDEACVVDDRLVTSRTPDDLPVFMQRILELVHAPV